MNNSRNTPAEQDGARQLRVMVIDFVKSEEVRKLVAPKLVVGTRKLPAGHEADEEFTDPNGIRVLAGTNCEVNNPGTCRQLRFKLDDGTVTVRCENSHEVPDEKLRDTFNIADDYRERVEELIREFVKFAGGDMEKREADLRR